MRIDTPEAQETSDKFCQALWPRLAEFGWRNYLTHGRGAVRFEWRAVEAWAEGAFDFSQRMHYAMSTTDEDPVIGSLIERYDPETEIVVIVAGEPLTEAEDGTLIDNKGAPSWAWIFGGFDLTPPKAYVKVAN